jgi:8-oxo-dGTP pyrophosphatase MutT (NUDIX family)
MVRKTIEKIVNVSVGIVFGYMDGADSVLCQKKGMNYLWYPGKWCLPGGQTREDESPKSALLRELSEEFNYSFNQPVYFKSQEFRDEVIKGDELRIRRGLQDIFTVEFMGKPSDLRVGEGVGFAFLSRQDLENHPFIPHDLKAIKCYFESH